ncbi:hypothetical protein SAMN05660461_0240 [Chitinophaga ginsengisegetis]|uniref:Uncharacterized protein n=1 Tax=Chitinophaga ginsengisegetis TaxID=393003 RepID=A0A1T5N4Z8_9BACT|nr:hypothetical protein [Chitinophaga ginsengisegetis]MDR6570955.1 hypothetical protein [Chitinophaga ginsengisegetis]MDR6650689.1 hypothetical protein [Chitinophaga ginsengisegetis]MDR6657039.1 hypothetical protein [Chitinophaga ginsengisegetis]SKC95118.1 hypothetical protein SAMN05660461_0240 [Chitinophaga ginsengisegetis]
MANQSKSPHILNTSTNLLGFCLIVLTSIKVAHFNHATIIDDCTGIAAILLMASCLLSFLSLKSRDGRNSERLEQVADYTFLVALICISITIVFVSFNLLS